MSKNSLNRVRQLSALVATTTLLAACGGGSDDPPPPPPYLEPNHMSADEPKAQQALMGFLRKVFPGPSH